MTSTVDAVQHAPAAPQAPVTAVAPTPVPAPAPPPRGGSDLLGPVLSTLVVLLLLTQRLGLPVGSTPVAMALPLVLVAVLVLLSDGLLRVDRVRLELFAIATLACLLATVLVFALGDEGSITSVGLLIATWGVFVLRAGPGRLPEMLQVARTFVRTMVVLALLGVAQLVSQFAGVWSYTDYIGTALEVLTFDNFNTSNPLFYESPIIKANGFVFLEPSFFSQFCALGVAVALVVRAPTWQVVALVAGVASAVSGTGIILLAATSVIVLLRARHLISLGLVIAVLTAAVIVALTPIGPLLEGRVGEFNQQGTSGSLRFVQPWSEVATGLEGDDQRYVIGSGAGSVQRELTFSFSAPVVYPVIPKAVYEYGVIAGGLFTLFIVVAMLDRMPWRVVPGTALVMVFFLSGNLLHPQTVLVVWLLTSVWTEQEVRRRSLLGALRRSTTHPGASRAVRRPAARR